MSLVPGARRSLPVVAIVLAGGTGSRAGTDVPKQFVRVAGRPVLEHTLEVFDRSAAVDAVVVVAHPDHRARVQLIVEEMRGSKVIDVVPGGADRAESTRRGIAAIQRRQLVECKVLVHDGVRPLLEHRVIDDCVSGLDTWVAIDVAIPTADTIVVVDDRGNIADIPPRATLRRGQTPQAFLLTVLADAHDRACAEAALDVTDDCGVVRKYLPDVVIGTVVGSERNIKVTHPQDFLLLDQLFRAAGVTVPASGPPVEGSVVVVLGAGRGIGQELAEHLRRTGAVVVAPSRNEADVRDEDAVRDVLASAEAEYGRVDSVVLTAGLLERGPLAAAEPDLLRAMMETNLWGAVSVARAAHQVLTRSSGQLLLFASSSYTRGRADYALYSATKAALVNLTQGLAEEWRSDGVRVNCISPGRTATDMRNGFADGGASVLTTHEVADACMRLLGSETSGTILDVHPAVPETRTGHLERLRTGRPARAG